MRLFTEVMKRPSEEAWVSQTESPIKKEADAL